MPTRGDVQKEIFNRKNHAQDDVRRIYLKELNTYTGNDTIIYASAFTTKKVQQIPGAFISVALDDIQSFMAALHELKGDKLDLILHSPGGSLEAAEQIVQYLRSKYNYIRVIIPQNAMSVATMIACAADEIVMGKHSALGPIDPQITFPTTNGHFTAPAQAILDEFEQAKKEVIDNPKVAPIWVTKIQSIPHGFLKICQNAIELSRNMVEEWLDTYMFKDSEHKGKSIAEWLVNNHELKSHGRPINLEKARELGLQVTALEDSQELQEKVLSLFHATMVTLETSDCVKLVENHLGKGVFMNLQIQVKP